MESQVTSGKPNSRACCRGQRSRYCPSVECFLTDPPVGVLPVGDEDRRSGTKRARTIGCDEIKLDPTGNRRNCSNDRRVTTCQVVLQLIRHQPYKHNTLTLYDTLNKSPTGSLKQNHDSMKIHLIDLELFFREDEPYGRRSRQDSSRKPAVLLVLVVDVVDDDVEEEEKEKKKDDDDDRDHGEKETTRMVDTLEYYWSCSSMPVIRV
ncbi:hypothetical protein WN48_08058 [Eufriesea mexicana]|uniref:Uncharacterized protein n=1 Tax=Eufriesea mexicana TaxID=516756 RepID=A0A310S8A7_9HYME|nr:hypothetical protein WN48_08058 [Eufriesea mexicana]